MVGQQPLEIAHLGAFDERCEGRRNARSTSPLTTAGARRRLFEPSAFGFGHIEGICQSLNRVSVRGATQALFEGSNCTGTQAGAFG
ncbi:MAG: hypothetical protein WBW89_08810 [Candidatus Cybelea sp.]